MQRDLVPLISRMIWLIPSSEREFIFKLERIRYKAAYAAPESIGLWWKVVANILGYHIPVDQDKVEWQDKVISIWMGTPVTP